MRNKMDISKLDSPTVLDRLADIYLCEASDPRDLVTPVWVSAARITGFVLIIHRAFPSKMCLSKWLRMP